MDKLPAEYEQTKLDVLNRLGYVRHIGGTALVACPDHMNGLKHFNADEKLARVHMGYAFECLTTDQQQRALELLLNDMAGEVETNG